MCVYIYIYIYIISSPRDAPTLGRMASIWLPQCLGPQELCRGLRPDAPGEGGQTEEAPGPGGAAAVGRLRVLLMCFFHGILFDGTFFMGGIYMIFIYVS